MKIEVRIERKHFFILAGLLAVTFLVACVDAYNSGNPGLIGHTWNEIAGIPSGFADGVDNGITQEGDPTVPANLKDGVHWSEIGGIPPEGDPTVPANLKDGVHWSEIGGIPPGFADGVDNVGCNWNGWKESNRVVSAEGISCYYGNKVCSWSVSVSLHCSGGVITDFSMTSYKSSTWADSVHK